MMILAAFLILSLGFTVSGVLYYVFQQREVEYRVKREKLINAYLTSRPHGTDEDIRTAVRILKP